MGTDQAGGKTRDEASAGIGSRRHSETSAGIAARGETAEKGAQGKPIDRNETPAGPMEQSRAWPSTFRSLGGSATTRLVRGGTSADRDKETRTGVPARRTIDVVAR